MDGRRRSESRAHAAVYALHELSLRLSLERRDVEFVVWLHGLQRARVGLQGKVGVHTPVTHAPGCSGSRTRVFTLTRTLTRSRSHTSTYLVGEESARLEGWRGEAH